MDAIIAMWERKKYASEHNLDIVFFKIYFDKIYDRVDWDFIL